MVYGRYAAQYPSEIKIVAVADPDRERRQLAVEEHGIQAARSYISWEQLLTGERIADVAIIATQDKMHYSPVLKALSLGYHILLEKPMSPSLTEVLDMAGAAKEQGRMLTVCHVLRYTPFWSKIKELLAGGAIGEIVSIQLSENVGYFHMAHSFVRGNWRSAAETSPMILQKSCHDMDLISWLMGKACLRVNSYGSLVHFRQEHAPQGAANRCTDGCPVERQCPYSAKKIYAEDPTHEWSQFITHELTEQGIMQALQKGPFGRCVYRCDNDVVDHQVVNMEFEGGATAAFTMSGFTHECSRTIQVMGTHGEIRGHMEKGEIDLYPFGRKPVHYDIQGEGRHGGGDEQLMRSFVAQVRAADIGGAAREQGLTSAEVSVQSHLMAFAAEQSRVAGGHSVEIKELLRRGSLTSAV